ncbi:hypothetical protein SAMD00023353_2600800 [Rosellinia necatrix]|uniref:Apple domain-containing protein n=1 Tax=Rosellinia necatrix TaxID=77044 RepID=A0A1W2TH76_ROSNE|nr:hypothetical protein SAMD00023353_2600800 [Rosellinia necatrix]
MTQSGVSRSSWQGVDRLQTSFGFRDESFGRRGISPTVTPSSTLELRPPEEGLEVGTPGWRRSQPGLIVVTGPQVVSPEDKLRKLEVQSWNSDPDQRDEVGAMSGPAEGKGGKEGGGKLLGLRRRTFWVFVGIAVVTFVSLMIGVAVVITRHGRDQSTSTSIADGGQASGNPPSMPTMATETASVGVAGDSSAFTTQSETPTTYSPSENAETATATGEGRSENIEPTVITTAIIIATPSTVFVVAPPAPTTVTSTAEAETGPPPQETTTVTATATASDTASNACLGKNGSIYTDPGTGDRFRIECGIARKGADIVHPKALNMEHCVSLCAANEQCRGAVWYNTEWKYCWMKSEITDNVGQRPDAQSFVRI